MTKAEKMRSKYCPKCGMTYLDSPFSSCMKCGIKLMSYEEYKHRNQTKVDKEYKELQIKKNAEKAANGQLYIPTCPTCGSTNVEKISTAAKVGGAAMFGLLSKTARSQFKCKNCGYKW